MGFLSVINSICDNYFSILRTSDASSHLPSLKAKSDSQLNDVRVNATPRFDLGGLALPSSGSLKHKDVPCYVHD